MKDYFFKLFKNPLVFNSFLMILGSNFSNFLNYLYHLVIGRLLGPSGYGELAGILSLSGLIAIIPGSLNLVVTKFISSTEDKNELNELIRWIVKLSFILGTILTISVLILSPLLSSFLNFSSYWLLIILALSFIFSIPASYNRSILQGKLSFNSFIITSISENLIRLISGVVLVYIGWSVFGAVFGILLTSIFGWFITKRFLEIKDKKKNLNFNVNKREVFYYTIPILIQSLASTSLYSSDLLLVKHYFDAHIAGIYASLSTLSKIIFFATGPIGAVMFPMASKRKAQNKNYFSVFWFSLLLTSLVCSGVLGLYFLFPNLIVNILYGSLFSEAEKYLFMISLSMALFAISSISISFALSINKLKIVIFPVISAVIQILGIVWYHQSLDQIIYVSVITNIFLCLSTIFYILKINISNHE